MDLTPWFIRQSPPAHIGEQEVLIKLLREYVPTQRRDWPPSLQAADTTGFLSDTLAAMRGVCPLPERRAAPLLKSDDKEVRLWGIRLVGAGRTPTPQEAV